MFHFPSVVGEANVRKIVTDYPNGYEVQYVSGDEVKRKFVGELAVNESRRKRYMMTDRKITDDALVLALTALHQTGISDFTVVTGVPVEQHVNEMKDAFRALLLGDRSGLWDVTVNGVRRVFRIHDVKVAVEGGAAFWSAPQSGLVRLIDAGSKTVNYVTMRDQRYQYLGSGTLPFGFNTERLDGRERKQADVSELAAQIAGELGAVDWAEDDTVLVAGGGAGPLSAALRPYFIRAKAVQHALYANAIGYYRAGKSAVQTGHIVGLDIGRNSVKVYCGEPL